MKKVTFNMERRMQLYRYLLNPPVDFNGWLITDIAQRAEKDLKFEIDPRNIKSVIKTGGLNIKPASNNNSPIGVLHNKIKLLQKGYLDLCRFAEVDPIPELANLSDEE